jgi:heme-degrading monooxygenase HmoA
MDGDRNGETAVIFTSRLTGNDPAGYAEAASRMETLAAAQPGYRGIESARGGDGFGITVSYWASEADAIAWRDQPDHAATREAGRAHWYADYQVVVAQVVRDYRWARG